MTTVTSRRTVLAAITGAGALAACSAAAAPRPDARPPTFVLVSGNSAPSFFWMPVVRELSRLGHRSHPVELPGHGLDAEFTPAYQCPQDPDALRAQTSVLGAVTLDDYAAAVLDAVRSVREHGPVVLVGHSLGGTVITRAADTAPELIDRLVYVSGFLATARVSVLDYLLGPENSESPFLRVPANELSDPLATGFTHTDRRTADRAYLEEFRAATMAEATESQFLAALNFTTQPIESARVNLEDARPRAEAWGRVPRSYVRLTADRVSTPANQDRMIADADALTPDNPFDVHDLDSSHSGIVLKAAGLAAILDRIGATVSG